LGIGSIPIPNEAVSSATQREEKLREREVKYPFHGPFIEKHTVDSRVNTVKEEKIKL
jgi:hypothetical protein